MRKNFVLTLSWLLMMGVAASASLSSEMAERNIDFWPNAAQPPFALAANVDDTGVIQVKNAAFDPLQSLPVIPDALRLPEDVVPRYQLVQFTGPITEAHKASLRNAGFEPLIYVSHFTFICRTMDSGAAETAKSIPEIRWVGPFEPAYRIDPLIGQTPMVDPERLQDDHLTLIVTLFEGESLSELKADLSYLTDEILDVVDTPYRKSLHIRLLPELIPELAQIESIYRIEEKGEFFVLNDETRYVIQSGSVAAGTPCGRTESMEPVKSSVSWIRVSIRIIVFSMMPLRVCRVPPRITITVKSSLIDCMAEKPGTAARWVMELTLQVQRPAHPMTAPPIYNIKVWRQGQKSPLAISAKTAGSNACLAWSIHRHH